MQSLTVQATTQLGKLDGRTFETVRSMEGLMLNPTLRVQGLSSRRLYWQAAFELW